MLFCPAENKINTPTVLNDAGMWYEAGYLDLKSYFHPPPPSVNAFSPLHFISGDGEAAADGGAAHCSPPLGLWQMLPSRCSTLITVHVEGSAARAWGQGRALLSCKCTARSALGGWRWIHKHADEHGGARCHSFAHLSRLTTAASRWCIGSPFRLVEQIVLWNNRQGL